MKRLLLVAALSATSSLASAQPVAVTLSEWKIRLASDTIRAGTVTFRINNAGSVNHGFFVSGSGADKGTREIPPGQAASLTVTLKPGTYEIFCPMSDESHKNAGMKRTLVVVPGDSSTTPKRPPSSMGSPT